MSLVVSDLAATIRAPKRELKAQLPCRRTCKNAEYLQRQKAAFLKGESAPDFAPENCEVRFEGRATPADLTELGKKQMGLVRCELGMVR